MITLLLIIPLIGCLCIIPISVTGHKETVGLPTTNTGDLRPSGVALSPQASAEDPNSASFIIKTDLIKERQKSKTIKIIALTASLLNLIVSIVL